MPSARTEIPGLPGHRLPARRAFRAYADRDEAIRLGLSRPIGRYTPKTAVMAGQKGGLECPVPKLSGNTVAAPLLPLFGTRLLSMLQDMHPLVTASIILAAAILGAVALHAYLSPYHSCVRALTGWPPTEASHLFCRERRN